MRKYMLEKVNDSIFKEVFVGYNEEKDRTVTVILDDNCVRWKESKKSKVHEFTNDKKAMCFKNASRALNR